MATDPLKLAQHLMQLVQNDVRDHQSQSADQDAAAHARWAIVLEHAGLLMQQEISRG